MTRITTLIAAALVVSGCTINRETDAGISVGYDEGGIVHTRGQQIERINAEGKSIVIGDGAICISACTMYLGADNVCVRPDASLGFHGAITIGEPPHGDHEYWTDYLARYYPPELREWFYASGASQMKFFWKTLSGAEVAAMGVPLCQS